MSEEFRTALGRTEERWSAQLDRLFERFEKSVDRLEAKFDLRMDATEKNVSSEFAEAKMAAGELRDGIAQLKERVSHLEESRDHTMRASAEGAARGAGEAAGAVATAAAAVLAAERPKPFLQTPLGRVGVACTAFSAIVLALGSIPSVLRGVAIFWTFVSGLPK